MEVPENSVHYQLNPEARQGTDFFFKGGHHLVPERGIELVIFNPNALEVVPEKTVTNPLTFYREQLAGKTFSIGDRALRLAQLRALQFKLTNISRNEKDDLAKAFDTKLTEKRSIVPF